MFTSFSFKIFARMNKSTIKTGARHNRQLWRHSGVTKMSRKIHHLNRIVQFWIPINLIFPRFPIRNPLSDTDGIWNWQDSAESIEKIQLKKVGKILIGNFYLFELIWYICQRICQFVLCLRWKTAECSSGLVVSGDSVT